MQSCHYGVEVRCQIVDGDTILAICARDLKKQGLLKNNKVVATVMLTLVLLRPWKQQKLKLVRSQVGDR